MEGPENHPDSSTEAVIAEDYPAAGLARRLASLLYDAFLVAAIWMLLGFIMQMIVGPDTNQLIDGQVQTDPLLGNILFALMVASCSGFFVFFWSRSGQTAGMIAWRIKTVNEQGGLINARQGILRFILAWPSFFCFGLGYLWLYIDKNGAAAHDRLSNTKVVLIPKKFRPL